MAKWPNVPHCYGWLLLDARGAWRMRDERAQALNLSGDRIANPALLDFIHRNYTHDEHGQWYFQNGPQRVYVDLEIAPFIVRNDPGEGLILHTGVPFPGIDSVWMTEYGQLVLRGEGIVALLDDRDLGHCLDGILIGNKAPNEEALSAWLSEGQACQDMIWRYAGRSYPVTHILQQELPERFRFIQRPRQRLDH